VSQALAEVTAMRRAILPALVLLFLVLPSNGQYGYRDARRTVERWYSRYLGREMDPYSGTWVQALQQGQDPNQVLSGILGSDEYYRRAGGTPARFVAQLYEDVGGRRPTPREVDYWARRVYHDSRSDIAYAILTRSAGNHDDYDRDDWRDRYDYRRTPYRYR